MVARERVTVGRDSVFTRALAFVPTRAAATLLEARAFVVGGAATVRHHLLVDVRAEKRAVSLLVGWESPVAALKITARKGEAGVVSLGRGTAVEVAVEALHESAGRHREALDHRHLLHQ